MTILLLFFPVALASICATNPTTYHFTLNTTRATILSDGPIFIPPTTFSAPLPAVKRAYDLHFRPTTPITLSQNILVLHTPSARLLIDTGALGWQTLDPATAAGRLPDNLAAARISPDSIDAVLVTHGHFDHVGGLTCDDGTAVFPNARVYVSKTEHEFWSASTQTELDPNTTEAFSAIYNASVAPYADRLTLVEEEVLPGVRFLPTPGHTPGHVAVEVTVGDERLVVTGDSFVSVPDQVRHPDWGYQFESNRVQAYESRIWLLELVARRRDLVLSYHEQGHGLGYVVKVKDAFEWIPADVGKACVANDAIHE